MNTENKVRFTGSNVTVMVSSMAKAVKFYTETLGLKLEVRHSSHWAEVSAPGITIGLHPKTKNKNIAVGENLSIGLQVEDINEAVRILEAKNIHFTIQKDSQVHLAYFSDLDNNVLYLFQLKQPKA